MSSSTPFRYVSLAHFICTFALAFTFGFAERAMAECNSEVREFIRSKCDSKEAEDPSKDLYDRCKARKRECESSGSSMAAEKTSCSERDRYVAAQKDLAKTCGKAGYGADCQKALDQCEQVAEDDEYPDGKTSPLLEAFTAAVGAANFISSGNKCPTYSGRDYFRDKKDIESDIKSNSRDLSDLKKESADLEDTFNKDIQEVQQAITDAQEKLKDDKLNWNKDDREQLSESAKTTSEVAAQIRSKMTQNLSIRNQMAEVYRSKNSSLLQMSETASKLACMKKVRDLRKVYDSEYAGSSNKGGLGFIKQASAKKQELNDTFLDCMSQFDVQRNALIAQTEEKIQVFQDMINSNISDIDNATQQLESAKIAAQQAKADAATRLTDAQQAITDKITKAQSRLTSLATTQQKKAKALSDKQAEMEAESRKKSNELAGLGPVPRSKSSDVSLKEVEGDYTTFKSALKDFETASGREGPCKGLYSDSNTKTTPTSRSTTAPGKR